MNTNIYNYVESEVKTLEELQSILREFLIGLDLNGYALRTRSRIIKEKICEALNYDIPRSFKKTKPKFPSQNLDVYTQKSNNLQIWNDEIDYQRRYAIIKLNEVDIVTTVKVITGEELSVLDTTGTLTTKYQARISQTIGSNICSSDTENISAFLSNEYDISSFDVPSNNPRINQLLPIRKLYDRILPLIGTVLENNSIVQERSRADEAHKLICRTLGYSTSTDDGQFPDIKHQLLEVKLQMSPTIDLGLHMPDSDEVIGYSLGDYQIKCSDVRYLIILAERMPDNTFRIQNIQLVSGSDFFSYYTLFGGKVQNQKIQLPLPSNFFD